MKTHKDLEVWKVSVELVSVVYGVTRDFPRSEIFGMCSQIRRAVVSVPVNISEGAARRTQKEFRHFLNIAFASLNELETLLIISRALNMVGQDEFSRLAERIKVITVMLSRLIKAVERRIPSES